MYKSDKIKIFGQGKRGRVWAGVDKPAGGYVSRLVLSGIVDGDVMKSPCLQCIYRAVGCHSSCGKYIEFQRTWNAAKERNRWHEGDYVPIGELKKKSSQFFGRMKKTNQVRER